MIAQGQFGSDLALIERAFFARVALWALASLLVGSSLLAALRATVRDSPLLRAFGMVAVVAGGVALPAAWFGRQSVGVRDFAGAVALDQRAWLSVGLSLGVMAAGVTLGVAGLRLGRRLDVVGAGIGIAGQGAAYALLHLQLIAAILR